MIKIVSGKKHINDMADGKIGIKHLKKIKKAFANYGDEVTKELKRVVTTGSRSGRVYFIKGRAHTASAKGEPPASLTGRLGNSFEYKARMTELVVGSTAFSRKGYPYPKRLDDPERLDRPFFKVTNERMSYILEKDLQTYDL